MHIRQILESPINVIFGKQYHKTFVLPKIRKASKTMKIKKSVICLSYDPDEIKDLDKIPDLLAWLKKRKLKASFAAIGKHIEERPELFRKILAEGHEIINHTYSHPDNPELNPNKHFHKISKKERFEEIKKCHDAAKKLLGYEMKGFRIPHFGNQYIDDIYPMLEKLGYRFSSSTVAIRTNSAGQPYKVGKIWELPMVCCPTHPFCIFDTSHAFRAKLVKHEPKEYIKTFDSFLKEGVKEKMFLNFYQDPQDLHRFDYEALLDSVKRIEKKAKTRTYEEIVDELEKNKDKRR